MMTYTFYDTYLNKAKTKPKHDSAAVCAMQRKPPIAHTRGGMENKNVT